MRKIVGNFLKRTAVVFMCATIMIVVGTQTFSTQNAKAYEIQDHFAAIQGCWHGNDNDILILSSDGQAIYAKPGEACQGSYTINEDWIYIDDLRFPVWNHGVKFSYALNGYMLLLWNEEEVLIFTKN